MQFINPSFLYALFAIAIPISIHLFNFRRYKTIYFTNVRFLKEVQLETRSHSRLKHLLVLLTRILAITALVLAFAQPYIPVDNKKMLSGDQVTSIYIDNSFSMDAIGQGGSLLDEAKKMAAEIAVAQHAGARFQLLTNDFEGRHQRLVSKEEFLQLLEEMKLSPAFKNLQQVISRQTDMLNGSESKNKTAYIISDFQKNMFSLQENKTDTTVKINLLPLTSEERSNLSIDSCWFASPVRKQNQAEQLHVRIKNFSSRDYENIPVKLFINEQQKTPASFNIKANSTEDIILSYTTQESGIQNARVELNDYPVTFDDKLYFSYTVLKQIPILSINGEANLKEGMKAGTVPYLESLFGKDSVVVLSNADEKHIDYSSLDNYRLIILNEMKYVSSGLTQELNKFVKSGGNLMIFPAGQSDLDSYKELLTGLGSNFYEPMDTVHTKVGQINYSASIFRDVFEKKMENIDLPVVFRHYPISRNSRSPAEALLKLQDGSNFLERNTYGKGQVYLFSVPLSSSWSNFARHAIFVPTLYQAVLYSQPQYRLFYIIGNMEEVEINATVAGDGVFKLNPVIGNKLEIIPRHRIVDDRTTVYFQEQVKEPGNYLLSLDKETLMGISFDYNRSESDLSVYSKEDMEKLIKTKGLSNFRVIEGNYQTIGKVLGEISEGKKLWKLCIILALLFLAAETLLLRLKI
jgi:hypothetical protein